jgi:hypothetical protein
MRAVHVFSGVGLIVTLGYIGVSWVIAGAGLANTPRQPTAASGF